MGRSAIANADAPLELAPSWPASERGVLLGMVVRPFTFSVRVLVTVSRGYPDHELVRRTVRALPDQAVLIGGGSRVTDRVPLEAAQRRGLETQVLMPPRPDAALAPGERPDGIYAWRAALTSTADLVIAFWDGQDGGTRQTINAARDRGVPVELRIVPTIQAAPSQMGPRLRYAAVSTSGRRGPGREGQARARGPTKSGLTGTANEGDNWRGRQRTVAVV